MSFPPCPSPPPPMPSPVLVPTPLPSPPPFTKKPSRTRLTVHSPPIPPSLSVRSSLLKKTLNRALSHDVLHRAARSSRSRDDAPTADDRRRPSSPPVPSTRTLRRTLSQLPSRCRSPPPSPAIRSPPPPVPPIPAFVLTTNRSFIRPPHQPSIPNRALALDLYLDHPMEDPANMRCESQAGGALTCMQFFAVHNQTGQCGA